MMSTDRAPLARAREAAERAVHRSGIELHEVVTAADANRSAGLLREVWRSPEPPMPGNIIRTVQHTGGYVFGAYDEAGTMLGISVGLLSQDGLHSHITGVAPYGQRRGLGFALKQHQRLWALERGIGTITWTCDPLIRRNVLFNVHALGARVVAYHPDFYGQMTDGVNAGDETDRLELVWDLAGPAALEASEGRLPLLVSALPLAVRVDLQGLPLVRDVGSVARRVQLPPDIEALRRGDASAGHTWRRAVRDAVVPALTQGAAVTGLTAAGELVLDFPSSPEMPA